MTSSFLDRSKIINGKIGEKQTHHNLITMCDLILEQKWIGKAVKVMKKSGTAGSFHKHCGGDVTQTCIDKAAKAGGKIAQKALFAANASHGKFSYPKKLHENVNPQEYETVAFDHREFSPSAEDTLKSALLSLGIYMYELPSYDGSDMFGYILSTKELSTNDIAEIDSDFDMDPT